MISELVLSPMMKPSTGIGRGKGKRGARGKTATPAAPQTPEEIHANNLRQVEVFTKRNPDLMLEALLNYSGSPERVREMYELVDQLYKRMPEGYGYSITSRTEHYGGGDHVRRFIQLQMIYKRDVLDRSTGKTRRETNRGMMLGPNSRVSIPADLLDSQSAIRGYAKAQVYRVAGKIYDTATRGVSTKYPALNSYGRPEE